MTIDFSKPREEINDAIIEALQAKGKKDGFPELIRQIVETVLGNSWVDEDLEVDIQDDLAILGGAETINVPEPG